jgi:hypothetical protein
VLQKMRAHLRSPPPPIGQLCPEVPAGLVALLDRMLAKDPADRFRSPAEVAEALRPLTSGSDLACLLDAAEAANAPLPAGLPQGAPPGLVPLSRSALPVTLAGLCLLLVAGVLWFWLGGPPGPAAKPLEITEMYATHSRVNGNGVLPLGDLRTSTVAVRLNDKVAVDADLSVPAYYYLIAFNPKGSEAGLVQLCQPEGPDGRGAEAVRPDPRTRVRSPNFIPDAVGLQAFVLAASTKPLPPYGEWRSRADPPWEGVKEGGPWRWHFDGREFIPFPRDRGRVEPREAVPEPLRKLCEFFKGRAEFEAVQVIAFPVVDDRK